MKTKEENTMSTELTTEQAKKLLNAIFAKEENLEEMTEAEECELADDNYPETITEKVGYAQYVITHDLQNIGATIHRLSRLYNLLNVSEKGGENKLPDIITNNELRMALKPLLQVENDIKDITEILTEIYRATKPRNEVNNHAN